LLVVEEGVDYTLYGKSSLQQSGEYLDGWLIGWVEKAGINYIYALKTQADKHSKTDKIGLKRLQWRILRQIFKKIELF
jgi:beta-lactamase class D